MHPRRKGSLSVRRALEGIFTALLSSLRLFISTQKLIKVIKLLNSCWLLLMTFVSFTSLAMISRPCCVVMIKMRLTTCASSHPSLLPLLKTGATFAFFQSLGTSSKWHNWSKVIKSDFVMTSANSLSTNMHPPSLQLDVSSLPGQYYLTWSPSTRSSVVFALDFPLILWDSRILKTGLAGKQQGEIFNLSYPVCHQDSAMSPNGPSFVHVIKILRVCFFTVHRQYFQRIHLWENLLY